MSVHRDTVGSTVILSFDDGRPSPKLTSYTVQTQMPPIGTSRQYRIKSAAEGFSRVVVGNQISPTGPKPVGPIHPQGSLRRNEEN
jgi:hypothetical protein